MSPLKRFIRGMSIACLAFPVALGASDPGVHPFQVREQGKPPEKSRSTEAIGFQSLIVEGGEACLVKEASGKKCLLTAERYNQQVFTLEMVSSGAFLNGPEKSRADSTRFLAMRAILYNLYKEKKLESAGLDSTLDRVSSDACTDISANGDSALTRRLVKYYDARYPSDFKARRVPVFDFIAGSDSAYIHSISKFLESQSSVFHADSLEDSALRRAALDRIDSLPWRRARLEDLGQASSSKAANDLGYLKWTSPIRTSYGFAILRLVDSTWTQEIFLPTIRDSLRLELKAQDGAFLKQAESYYRSNGNRFPKPDTLFFGLALCPDSNCVANARMAKPLSSTSEYSLPVSTRVIFKSAYTSRRPDSAWFETPLGFARMVSPRVRRGKGNLPFEEVKAGIFKEIDSPADSSVLSTVKCKQIRRRVADQFVPYLYQDVAALLKKHNLRPGQKTLDPVLRGSIKDAQARFRGEFKSWMEGLAIDLPDQ